MNKLCPMPGCRVEQITREDPGLLSITAKGTRPGGRCPDCGQASRAVHSRYRRRPADLPSLGRVVRLDLRLRRFYCRNAACTRHTFAERLPELIRPHARRTGRLAEAWVWMTGRCARGAPTGRLWWTWSAAACWTFCRTARPRRWRTGCEASRRSRWWPATAPLNTPAASGWGRRERRRWQTAGV